MRPDDIKMCTMCAQELPATADYFDRDSSKPSGFKSVCKACRAIKDDHDKNLRLDENVRLMDDAALAMLQQMARGGSDVPHVAEVYQNIMQAFDGAGGFAVHFMNQYLSCKPGSAMRNKLLETIVSMSKHVSESGAAQIPLELMSDEDLQNKLEQQTRKILRIADVDGAAEKAS